MITLIEALGGVALFLGVIYFCTKKVAEMIISKAVEDYKSELSFDTKKREKAALVAELLSEWVKKPMDTSKVHKLLWEASMWLPDAEAKDLNDLLAHTNGLSTKQVIIKIRAIVQGRATALKPEDLTHFSVAQPLGPIDVPTSAASPCQTDNG